MKSQFSNIGSVDPLLYSAEVLRDQKNASLVSNLEFSLSVDDLPSISAREPGAGRELVLTAIVSILISRYHVNDRYCLVVYRQGKDSQSLPIPVIFNQKMTGDLAAQIRFIDGEISQMDRRIQSGECQDFPVDPDSISAVINFRSETQTAFRQHLNISVRPSQDPSKLQLTLKSPLLSLQDLKRFESRLRTFLTALQENPNANLETVSVLPKEESELLLNTFNATQKFYPDSDWPLHKLFERQVGKHPDRICVRFEQEALTFRQVDLLANGLANHLIEVGVQKSSMIPLMLPRSNRMLISILGILKAGAAYVPIDTDLPEDRIEKILQDLSPTAIVIDPEMSARISSRWKMRCIDAGSIQALESFESVECLKTDPIYGIYTSGTTGMPKCAVNVHAAVVNRILWMQDQYHLQDSDCVLQKTPYSFDVSAWEFFWPILSGARIVFAEPDGHKDPFHLLDLIEANQVTTIHFVPSMLQIFLEYPVGQSCQSLRRVFCSGEALPKELVQRFFSVFSCELHNLYGPTEAAIDVSYWDCKKDETRKVIPIGFPIANIRLFVVDPEKNLMPIGIPGELLISGVGLAKEYWNRKQLTEEKFVSIRLPDHSTERAYRTGDLCRMLSDGSIEYLGRMDSQVKIRGVRIELGEIESHLLQLPEVQDAVVLVLKNHLNELGLVSYVVLRDSFQFDEGDLKKRLGQQLPSHLIPDKILSIQSIPLGTSGKKNRQSLPIPNDWYSK